MQNRVAPTAEFVRALLQTDPHWAVYSLGDLAPGHAEHCSWISPAAESRSLALLYTAFDTPIFWAMGDVAEIAPFSPQIFQSRQLILQIRPSFEPLVRAHYARVETHAMWRMRLDPGQFSPIAGREADRRLTAADMAAVEELYSDGIAAGQQPAFFFQSMLESGVFFGAWEGGRLVAAAGTHLYSKEERAAAIGNVYTRRSARRKGHAARLTSAVVTELLATGVSTIALSVRQSNPAAIAAYLKLGFVSHCEFFEGRASR